MGGLPADAPAAPKTPYQFPAVHDMPPPRTATPMSDDQQIKLEQDLEAARDRQMDKAGEDPDADPDTTGADKAGGGHEKEAGRGQKTARRLRRLARRRTRDKSQPGSHRPAGEGSDGHLKVQKVQEPMEEFYRIRRLPPYVFEEVNRAKAKARNAGADIIDLGMGNPDLPAPQHVIDKLKETLGKPRTDRYSSSRGIPGLRRAQAAYYERRFGVKLNPDTQVVATLGSKEGFANVAQAITAPGDVVLVPDPSYPIHAFGFLMAGGVIRSVSSEPTPDFFATLERAITHSIPKPIAVVVCYPSNPTAFTADLDFYRDLVAFAKKHGIFILSDLAYAEVYFDNNPPPSVLQVPGAMDVTVEFTSMSKTYSMAGWRMGFAVGNERIIAALARVKSYLDYGAFTPVQVAAAAALNGPDDCVKEMRETYRPPP